MLETWRLIPYDSGSTIEHVALSDALVRHVDTPTVWWHSTNQPTLILGASQLWSDREDRICRSLGVTVVRRQAGGTSVFASAGVLGLDIALPSGHPLLLPDLVEGYRWLGQLWIDALAALHVDAHLVSITEARTAPPPTGAIAAGLRAACFGTVSPYEVLVRGRKLVGLAQVRRRAGGLLQSGIHMHFHSQMLAQLLDPGNAGTLAPALQQVAVGLRDVAPKEVTTEDIMNAAHCSLQRLQHVRLEPGTWTPEERAHAALYHPGIVSPASADDRNQ
jgi:lipoate---protein ligase